MSTQKQQVLSFLNSGKELSKYHAENRMHIGNPREVVRRLRKEGHTIYTNRTPAGSASYRLGTPTRRIVARAYRIYGAQIFN